MGSAVGIEWGHPLFPGARHWVDLSAGPLPGVWFAANRDGSSILLRISEEYLGSTASSAPPSRGAGTPLSSTESHGQRLARALDRCHDHAVARVRQFGARFHNRTNLHARQPSRKL